MSGLSYPERACFAFAELAVAQGEGRIPPCRIYPQSYAEDRAYTLYVIPWREPNHAEWRIIKKIADDAGFDEFLSHPTPPPERILAGHGLMVTTGLVKAIDDLLEWISQSPEAVEDTEYVLMSAGVIIVAWWAAEDGDDTSRAVTAQITFSTEELPFTQTELSEQAEFATQLINRRARASSPGVKLIAKNMGVIINGQALRDIGANTPPPDLLRQYRHAIGDGDQLAIRARIATKIKYLQQELEVLETWQQSPTTLLPAGLRVASAKYGILCFPGEEPNSNIQFVSLIGELNDGFRGK